MKVRIKPGVLATLAVFVVACDVKPRAPTSTADEKARWLELAQQYQANLGWIERVTEIADRNSRILTVDLQREWLSGPIVFPGVLLDATRTELGSYVLHIRDDGFMLRAYEQSVILQLECSAAQAAQVLQASSRAADAYAVQPTLVTVARITRVSGRRYLEASHEIIADEDHPSGGYAVESTLTKDWKIGFGECIHLESIGYSAN